MKIATIIILVALLVLCGVLWLGGTSKVPINIYTAPNDDPNLVQWKKDWKKASNSIVTLDVISNESDQIFVYVDYIYSGEKGPEATTCGKIMSEVSPHSWYCSPTGVKHGRGFVTLRLGISQKAENVVCSEKLKVNFYHERKTFFEQEFEFQKKMDENK